MNRWHDKCDTETRMRVLVAVIWLTTAIAVMFVSTASATPADTATVAMAAVEMSTEPTQPALEPIVIADTVYIAEPVTVTTVATTVEPATVTTTTTAPKWRYPLTESEIRLIALVAEREDRNAMQAVAEVILNRVESEKFPDSVEKVVRQRNQFYVVRSIGKDDVPCDEAVAAVMTVFCEGVSVVPGAIFFAEKSVKASRIARGLVLVKSVGGTNFYSQE